MSAREIIARAYDREQASHMGEPDPWEDGTDHPEWDGSLGCADAAIAALSSAGYRILAPGKMDSDTLEAAAKKADEYVWDDHSLEQSTDVGRACHFQSREIAEAIRNLRSAG
jgi:hypothetical protein